MSNEWLRPIVFEGVTLPDSAIGMDHLGNYNNLPELSEGASEWLWHFSICVGRPKTDPSEHIIRHASEVLALAEASRDQLKIRVPEHFDESFRPEFVDEWIESLRTIIQVASTKTECTWEAPLRPGEPNYGRPWKEIESEMLSKLDQWTEMHEPKEPWWKRLLPPWKS